MHICTITVALVFNILHFFLSPSPHSLIFSFSFSSLSLSLFISGPSVHRSVQPHSHQSVQQATTDKRITTPPLMNKSQRCHWWTNWSAIEEERRSKPPKKQVVPPLLLLCRRRSLSKLTHCYDRWSSRRATTDCR